MIAKPCKKSKKSKFIRKYYYRGRFAPSPTGPLHYGSLVAALASYLQARSQFGEWYVRIENIDPPRESKGATSAILQTLTDYGFKWDANPLLQSHQIPYHRHIALQLIEDGHAYYCDCSRKDISKHSESGTMGLIYPGICSKKDLVKSKNCSIRLRTDNSSISYIDKVYGLQSCNLKKESGDYIIYRTEDLPSYILSVSIDDLLEDYTEIVRGHDLLPITPRQIYLSTCLNKQAPSFMHIPIIVNDAEEKLSKQTYAPKIKKHQARDLLINALTDLGQEPPRSLRWRPLWVTWAWAIQRWDSELIPTVTSIKYQG